MNLCFHIFSEILNYYLFRFCISPFLYYHFLHSPSTYVRTFHTICLILYRFILFHPTFFFLYCTLDLFRLNFLFITFFQFFSPLAFILFVLFSNKILIFSDYIFFKYVWSIFIVTYSLLTFTLFCFISLIIFDIFTWHSLSTNLNG